MKEYREGHMGEKGIKESSYEINDSPLNFSRPYLLVYMQNYKINFKY
jgi:hypothetical protein